MIKILYIVSTLKRCGPNNQLFNIINNLDETKFSPVVITLSPEPMDSRFDDYVKAGIEVHSLNLSRFSGVFFVKSKVRKLIDEFRPNIIHTQGVRGDIVASQIKGIPKVSTVRNFPQLDFPMTYGSVVGRWMVWRQIKALRNIDKVVGVSTAVVDNLQSQFSIQNTYTISNGVEVSKYVPISNSRKRDLRGNLQLPINATIWIVSGHLNDRKDPLFLIDAWKRYFSNDIENFLLFIGDGPLLHECKQQSKELTNIRVEGRVKDVVSFLQASDIYLASSKAEGLPNAALEAMSCGLPVLLSDIGPHCNLLTLSPEVGESYEIGDISSFGQALERFNNRDYKSRSDASYNLIRTSLSDRIMSDNYQQLYLDLVDR